ncbi:hypothetical protein FRP1_16745 [Pseudonocardia sp. EC080625-04]|nr:hypothetical protein FRP1_16745 [Pseudonocardia sp. EC080625-04]
MTPVGCAVLDPAQTALFSYVDSEVIDLAARQEAVPVIGPGLLATEFLQRIDFFRNFPQLALHPATYTTEFRESLANGTDPGAISGNVLIPGTGLLPSATCYGVFGSLQGIELRQGSVFTAVGRCFRNEDSYRGLARLMSFHMREIIAIGTREDVEAFRTWGIDAVHSMATHHGLKLGFEPANDPFYLKSSRALLTALDPVKFEFLADDGTAIASVNRHRNFFGERLGITIDGEPAHSVCLAFGLERWVHALSEKHGTADAALPVSYP